MGIARPFLRGRVLVYGCGIGALADGISPDGYLGVERDAESLSLARQWHPRHRFSTEIPAGSRFETIVALALLEYLPDSVQWLQGMRSCMNWNGKISARCRKIRYATAPLKPRTPSSTVPW
jgi:Methyltransferase domain